MESETLHKLPVFFILGRPRSGTTLLRTLFDAHPGVKIPVEYPIIFDIYNKFKHVKIWNERNVETLYRTITGRRIYDFWDFGNLKIDPEEFRSQLHQVTPQYGLTGVFRLIHYLSWSAFKKEEILCLGDKNPVYSLFLEDLLKIFPDARFICLVRDPRDTFASMRKFEFEAPNAAIQAWRWNYIAKLFRKMHDRLPGQVTLIRYEDLVADPSAELVRLCKFLGIPYDQEMLRFADKKEEILNQYSSRVVEKFQKSLLEPISEKKVNSWKDELSQADVAVIDHAADEQMRHFNYDVSGLRATRKARMGSLIWSSYAALLYYLMRIGNRLPWWLTQPAASLLPLLRKIYVSFSRNSK